MDGPQEWEPDYHLIKLAYLNLCLVRLGLPKMKQQQEVIVGRLKGILRHLQKCERGTVRLQCELTIDMIVDGLTKPLGSKSSPTS
jgi:hypothetical protein